MIYPCEDHAVLNLVASVLEHDRRVCDVRRESECVEFVDVESQRVFEIVVREIDADEAVSREVSAAKPASPPRPPIADACRRLCDRLGRPPWLQSVGYAESGGKIVLNLVRPPLRDTDVPASWEGYPVEAAVVGRVVIGPPGDGE